jgi:hypothetical protein
MADEHTEAHASRLGESAEPEEIVRAELIASSPHVGTPGRAIHGRRLMFSC